jgi:ATP-dependent Clp protease ATP-binding subunit ClpC
MTSNIGTSLFSQIQMGYQSDLGSSNVSRTTFLKSLKKYFSAEFLNRLDDIIIFNHLTKENIKKIIALEIAVLRKNLSKHGKEISIDDKLINLIIEKGYSKEYGARNISRTFKSLVIDKLAADSLGKQWVETKYIHCSASDGQAIIDYIPFDENNFHQDSSNQLLENESLD